MKTLYTLLLICFAFSTSASAQGFWTEDFEATTATTGAGNINNYEGAGFIRRTSPRIAGAASMVGGVTANGFNQFFMSGWFELKGGESFGYQHRMSNNITFAINPGSIILRVTLVPFNSSQEILVDSFNYALSPATMTTLRSPNNISLNNFRGFYRLRFRVTQTGGNNANARPMIDNITSSITTDEEGNTGFLANTKVEFSNGNKEFYEFGENFTETFTFINQGPNTLQQATFSVPFNGLELTSFITEGGEGISFDQNTQKLILSNIPAGQSRKLLLNYNASRPGEFTSSAMKTSQTGSSDPISSDDSFSRSFSVNGPLPVVMIFFNAAHTNEGVKLSWATASETNSHYFQIERFNDRTKNFEAIGKIFSAGNTNKTTHYQYIDMDATSQVVNYRLKQLDKDGKFEYFSASIIQQVNAINLKVYPNPAVNFLNIQSETSLEDAFIRVVNLKGEVQNITNIDIKDGNATLLVENLKSGIYLVQVQSNGTPITFKFTKN